jgi:hypothetical protein
MDPIELQPQISPLQHLIMRSGVLLNILNAQIYSLKRRGIFIRRTPRPKNLCTWGKLPPSNNQRTKDHRIPHSTKRPINKNQTRIRLRLSRRLPTIGKWPEIESPDRRRRLLRGLVFPLSVERSSVCFVETGCKCQVMEGWNIGSGIADAARVVAYAICGWPTSL